MVVLRKITLVEREDVAQVNTAQVVYQGVLIGR